MSRARRWILAAAGLVVAGAVAIVIAAWVWLPSDAEVGARIRAEFMQRTGVELDIKNVHWSLWPQPMLVIEDASTRQAKPIVVRRLSLQAPWRSVLHREFHVEEVEIDGAVVPRQSLSDLHEHAQDSAPETGAWAAAAIPVEHLRFRDVTWVDRRDIELAYDGEVDFDADWRPRHARIARAETTPPVQMRAEREGETDRWRVLIDVPGGTWNGDATWETKPDGRMAVHAQLEPKGVDVEALATAFKRRSVVAGRLSGKSDVNAEADKLTDLVASLRTRTRFAVKPARLTRFDLAKAVSSAGTSRGGQTPLDELTGTVDTQMTDNGVIYRYTDLRARSGVLTATGNVRLFNRKLDGEAAVDIVDGVVGVPLKIGGTVEQPELSLTGGALTGAAIGTAVLPGVGTALGARIGQQVERLFGSDDKKKPGKAPSPAATPRR
ncbi:AsmA-like C-terminal region-containing protein [Variovorax sp. J22R133]|uniref:AsmA-like C-terminal region-containing protein n=1 Tax=Variovorax brevis TaxID=3053503 RepID=UPI002578EB6F|nr:AsmA-like C-terminal region-containing protein [Variovorax sp. J22R133]MDM0111668.1 AsmA-like C-terminal region-containing protein [Variovorax sp. J22R133]